MSDWREYLALAHEMADASAAVIMEHFRRPIEIVDKNDRTRYSPVTVADKNAESAIRALIRARFPDHGILGEEHAVENPDASLVWVLDPIDGTKAFISGFPTWGTLIALTEDGRPLIGMMNQPVTGERFFGHPEGAYLGEKKLHTRACARLEDASLFCTEPEMFAPGYERNGFDALSARVVHTRYGGDCYAYSMLAMGFVDLVVEADLKPWDIQALVPIVAGAGGTITDWEGGPAGKDGRVVAAGDAALHAEVLAVLRGAPPKARAP